MNSLYESKGKEAIFRSKVKWIEQGEKPTKYFFNLEKKNYVTKTLLQIKLDNGEITSDMKKINKQIEVFFSETYKSKLTDVPLSEQELGLKDFIQNLEIPRLSNEEQATFEHELTVQEIKNVLHSFEKNKTPGEDGFSKEFYETFFDLLNQNLLDSYNEAFQKGSLSVSQRRGVISLIPKNDCDLSELTGWRPITLLNVDYKILAKCIAKRIEPFLPKLIHSDQTGFMKDRFIGQNVRRLNDLMEYTDVKKISGIFLFIDFEKAFDSIEWNFIKRSLELFNLGPFLTRWFSIFYSNSEAVVMNAGYMTDYFTVPKGVRQGYPLSPFLFILSVELLALKIRQEPYCKGISLPNLQDAKTSQFADDTTLISKDTNSLQFSLQIIGSFGSISGLGLNKKKTKAMWIGSSKHEKTKILDLHSIKDPIKIHGAHLSYNADKNNDANFFSKIRKMKNKPLANA